MKIVPPKEIMKYIAFKDGLPVKKENMPCEYSELFEEYREDFIAAKKKQKERIDSIEVP